MQVIHKETIPSEDTEATIMFPEGAVILSAQMQDGDIAIWFKFEENYKGAPVARNFKLVITGEVLDTPYTGNLYYISTIQLLNPNEEVVHLYEVLKQ